MACGKKFLNSLAAEFRRLRPDTDEDADGDSATGRQVWEDMVRATATLLAQENERFAHARFFEACGLITD